MSRLMSLLVCLFRHSFVSKRGLRTKIVMQMKHPINCACRRSYGQCWLHYQQSFGLFVLKHDQQLPTISLGQFLLQCMSMSYVIFGHVHVKSNSFAMYVKAICDLFFNY